ncbi:TonB-dependent receptor plug domain-containing protein [Bradyrhizobium sp. 2TAF24]|uniref:TonB-dependent receptor plug domain-containing protein n=1 Tax=Bradyrhizobium sp. 2TAF24 TaxID=3233011 RepID=UPI003F8F0958
MSAVFTASKSRRRQAVVTSIAAPLLFTAISQARAQPAPTAAQNLPEIVVSATRTETPAEQIGNSVTVISGKDLERDQRRTVPDALATVPGLNVVQSGGPGGLTAVFIRGTNANHTKVLIDGIDVSNPSDVNRVFDLGQLLTSDIERIEVLRGPQSGLYGADAIGGVISITTRKGEGPPRATASIEGGSFGTFNQDVGLSGSQDRISYAFNVSHFASSNTPVTPSELLPPGQRAIGNWYDNMTYSTKLGVDVTDDFALNVTARYTDATLRFTGDTFNPVTFSSTPSPTQSTQQVRQIFTRAEGVWSLLDGRFKNYFGVNYASHWNFNADPSAGNSTNTGDRVKYDWRGVLALLPAQTLVIGAEHEREQLNTATVFAENVNKGAYLELQSEFFKRLFVVSNIRLDDNDRFGDHTTWRVVPAYIIPGTETRLKASYGTGFKAPTLSQLYVDYPSFLFFANPNLKPEQSTGYDAGFEQPVGDRFRFGATYFHNDITDLINTVSNPATFSSTYVNIGAAETEGVETFATWTVSETVQLRGDYTYTRAIDKTTGLELLRRPKNKASVTANWSPSAVLSVSGTVLYVGSFIDSSRDFSIPRMTAPGYTVVNLAADYTINDQMKLFGRIDNLFNQRYQDPTGFLRPGFGIFGGVRVASYGVR